MRHRRLGMTAALLCLVGGCAENRASFFVQQALVPTDECEVEASEDALSYTSGVLDLSFRSLYQISVLLKNQLSPRGNVEALVSETNGIQVEGAEVRIWPKAEPTGDILYEFFQPGAIYVPPNGIAASSFNIIPNDAAVGLVSLDFPGQAPGQIPPEQMVGFDRLVTVGIRLRGLTNGGTEVETPEFFFPVHVCYGCLVRCPPDSGGEGLGLCESTELPEGSDCRLGQDDAVDCRWCATIFGSQGPQFCRETFCGIR